MTELQQRRRVLWAGHKLARAALGPEPEFPWRNRRTPYRIFLAEILLVRTRSDMVCRIFDDVYNLYPDMALLAAADEKQLSELLHPLGLSKRVVHIINAAKHVCDNHGGEVPANLDSLMAIPGLGVYTASAILTFAFQQPIVPGDVNILRFLSRLTDVEMVHKTKGSKRLWELLPYLSEDCTGLESEKLLDFTRLTCRPRKPGCINCCLSKFCAYARE